MSKKRSRATRASGSFCDSTLHVTHVDPPLLCDVSRRYASRTMGETRMKNFGVLSLKYLESLADSGNRTRGDVTFP